ncbi:MULTISPECIES: hypothetical protein [unclassified Kitasatospora]|uniref:hypothetical protein n=1 Tax=unclassified Kitasatospora TaxID=2633591 RepID=UPI001F32BFE3|nr:MULTISPECIES: hypothetical protein [unclassified Kitasatospora]
MPKLLLLPVQLTHQLVVECTGLYLVADLRKRPEVAIYAKLAWGQEISKLGLHPRTEIIAWVADHPKSRP